MIGVDASAAAMAGSSRRAARPVRRGGLPNAMFAVAAAERPPAELIGRADELTVLLPWGSLLRGALALDAAAAAGIAALLAADGRATALVSVTDRDRLAIAPLDDDARDGLAARWERFALAVSSFRAAAPEEAAELGSSWARRLAAGRDRSLWRIDLVRRDDHGGIGAGGGRGRGPAPDGLRGDVPGGISRWG